MKLYCFISLMGLMLLSSCNYIKPHPLPHIGPNDGVCKKQCYNHYQKCSHECVDDKAHCVSKQRCGTRKHYRDFVHENTVAGGVVHREVGAYQDPLQCLKTTCACYTDYTTCTKACFGVYRGK